MLGIIIQLSLSWLIIWFFERKNLSVLGLTPSPLRLKHFVLFFMVSALGSASGFMLKMTIAHQQWQLNSDWSILLLAEGVWYNIKSVLYEELIFRGVIFYVLIMRLGNTKAIIISAAAFGVYHWFSFELLNNPTAMIVMWIATGSMGLVLAYGFAKTQSLYIPIAIHLGWNLIQQIIFSSGPIGKQLLVEILPQPIITVSYFEYFLMMFFPLVSTLLINFILIKRIPPVSQLVD